MLKEKFNLVLEESAVAGSDYDTKISTMFAADLQPDLLKICVPPGAAVNSAEAGYSWLLTRRVLEMIPNYKNLWSDPDAIDYTFNYISHNGKIYFCLQHRIQLETWHGRIVRDIFDKLGVTSFPDNPDEFYNFLIRVRDELGIIPIVESMTHLSGRLNGVICGVFMTCSYGSMFP